MGYRVFYLVVTGFRRAVDGRRQRGIFDYVATVELSPMNVVDRRIERFAMGKKKTIRSRSYEMNYATIDQNNNNNNNNNNSNNNKTFQSIRNRLDRSVTSVFYRRRRLRNGIGQGEEMSHESILNLINRYLKNEMRDAKSVRFSCCTKSAEMRSARVWRGVMNRYLNLSIDKNEIHQTEGFFRFLFTMGPERGSARVWMSISNR